MATVVEYDVGFRCKGNGGDVIDLNECENVEDAAEEVGGSGGNGGRVAFPGVALVPEATWALCCCCSCMTVLTTHIGLVAAAVITPAVAAAPRWTAEFSCPPLK